MSTTILVFEDWKIDGKSIYATELGIELSIGDLHSGSIFRSIADLPHDEIKDAWEHHKAYPVFRVLAESQTWIADPTEAEVEAVCNTMNSDFGLFGEALKDVTREDAREWFNAWRKEIEKRCHG